MAKAFRRAGRREDRRYVATLDPDERDLVATLMEQVADLLAAPEQTRTGDDPFDEVVAGLTFEDPAGDPSEDAHAGSGPAPSGAPRDPALERLLPSAHREDPTASAEFRRLTEGGLRHRKAAGLLTAVAALRGSGNEVSLDPPTAAAFLTALTDVRLVLGSRLGLETDEDLEELEARAARADGADPLVSALALYDFLTWLQETLAGALLRS